MASPLDFNAVLGAQLRDAAAQMRSMRTPPRKDAADMENLPAASDADVLPDAPMLAAHDEAQPTSDKEQAEQDSADKIASHVMDTAEHMADTGQNTPSPSESRAAHAAAFCPDSNPNSHGDSDCDGAHDSICDSTDDSHTADFDNAPHLPADACTGQRQAPHATTAHCAASPSAPSATAFGPVTLPVEPPTVPNALSQTLPKASPLSGTEEETDEEDVPYTITQNVSPLKPDALAKVRHEITLHALDADASVQVRQDDIHLARSVAQEVAQNRESQSFDKSESGASSTMPDFLLEEMPAFMSQPFIPQLASTAAPAAPAAPSAAAARTIGPMAGLAQGQWSEEEKAQNTGQEQDQGSGPLLSNKTWSGGVRGAVLNALRQLAGNEPEVRVNLKRLAAYADLSYGSVRNAMSQLVRSGDIRSRQIRVADGHGVLVRFLTAPGTEGTARPLSLSSSGRNQSLSAAQTRGKGKENAPAHTASLSAHSLGRVLEEVTTTATVTDAMTEGVTAQRAATQANNQNETLPQEYPSHSASPHSTQLGHASFWETDHALFALAWPSVAAAGLTMEGLHPLAPVFAVQGFDVQILPRCLRYLDWQLETMAQEGCSAEERDNKVREFVQWLQRRGTWPKPQGYEE